MLKHEDVEKRIRGKILSGEFRQGAMLPGRRELARIYSTSTLTIGRAIDGLVREGLLRSDDRRGTFVSDSNESVPPAVGASRKLTIAIVVTLFPPHRDLGFGHNPWTRQIVASLEEELAGYDHETVLVNTVQADGSFVTLDRAVERALSRDVDGIIVAAFTNPIREVLATQKMLLAAGLPCVVIGSSEIELSVPHVRPDGIDAGRQVGNFLLRQGCRQIAFLCPVRAWWASERHEGLVEAFEHADISPENLHSYPADPSTDWDLTSKPFEASYSAAESLLRDLEPFTGVVAANDEMATAVLAAAKDLGLVAGADFLLVGFDDIPEALHLDLTTIRVPWDVLGVEAARLLRNSLARKGECLQVRVRWRLIPRASTRWKVGFEPNLRAAQAS